jgi:hypothetical protein
MRREVVVAERVLRYKITMDRKRFSKSESERKAANLLTGERALARQARLALERRKRPPEDGEVVPAALPDKPKPIIGGAEAAVE